jgi:hypothetical protein
MKDFLWNYEKYNYYGVFWSLRIIFKNLKNELLKGKELSIDKKIQKIDRCIQILTNIIEDRYLEMSELINGKFLMNDDLEEPSEEQSIINIKIIKEKNILEEKEWVELLDIIKGQNIDDLIIIESITGMELYDQWFNGSGLRKWWR